MAEFFCRPGDVLLYEHPSSLVERLIEDGERMSHGSEKRYFYHCAVALGPYDKVEALWRVRITPIDYSTCVVCRPPYTDQQRLNNALGWGRKRVGRWYGVIGVIDQALRDATHNRIHLPDWFVSWLNRVMPYCSILTAGIVSHAGFGGIRTWPPPDPQCLWDALKDYVVYDYRHVRKVAGS